MNFLRNCWYMAAWGSDIGPDALIPVTILDEPIVIYRKQDNTLAALEDRCCHRLVPLSVGRKEADEVRCMYHGIKFAADGRCTEIPGQDRISPAVRVRSYPAVERHGAVWLWMGVPDMADEALIPPIIGPNNPEWAVMASCMEIQANAQLIVDNVLDLSHAPYVHEASFGGGDETTIKTQIRGESGVQVTELERGVQTMRWHLDRPSNPYTGDLNSDDLVMSQILAPGIFILKIRVYKPGVQQRPMDEHGVPLEEPLFARTTCQMITPVSDQYSKFFFTFGPSAALAHAREDFFRVGEQAFREDKAIIEEQQRLINRTPNPRMMMLAMDVPVIRYNKIHERLLEQEATTQGVA